MGELIPSSSLLRPSGYGGWIRAIRLIRGSILPLLAAVCFFPFSRSANAQTLASVDGFDCITAYEVEEEPIQVCDNSPNPWNDLDEISLPLNDKAVIPSRYGKDTPHFTSTTVAPIALHQPGLIPAFLFPPHSSDTPPDHIRERAPPSA